jgi:hypothetical protein
VVDANAQNSADSSGGIASDGITRRTFFELSTAAFLAPLYSGRAFAGESSSPFAAQELAESRAVALISNETVRVLAFPAVGTLALLFCVKDSSGRWRPLISNGAVPGERGTDTEIAAGWYGEDLAVTVAVAGRAEPSAITFTHAQAVDARTLLLSGTVQGMRIEKRITLLRNERVHVSIRPTSEIEEVGIGQFMSHFYWVPDGRSDGYALPLDLAWLPVLHWQEEDIAAEHFFRSPCVMAMSRGAFAALVPDLTWIKSRRPITHALDLRVTRTALNAPRLSYGLCTSEIVPHTYARHRNDVTAQLSDEELGYAFYLCLGEAARPAEVMESVSTFLWDQYGHSNWRNSAPQVLPFEEYGRRYAYVHELRRWATPVQTKLGEAYGINNPNRIGANFTAWENDLHVAFGLLHYGRKWDTVDLKKIGVGILTLIQSAPRNQGAFPSTFNFKTRSW